MTERIHRYRISTKFNSTQIFLLVVLFSIGFYLVKDMVNNTVSLKSLGLLLGVVPFAGVLYFIRTIKQIDYDDVKQVLYVIDKQKQTEIEIPVENIDKILFSAMGFGNGSYSYLIVYRGLNDSKQSARLFPIPFDKTIHTIIADAKLKNPNLVTRNWSIGLNELTD